MSKVVRQILPGNVKPIHYTLAVKTDLEGFTFEGSVTIDFKVVDPKTDYISVNSKDLELSEGSIGDASVKSIYDSKLETATFKFDKSLGELAQGKDQLAFTISSFKGKLTDLLAGYYRSSYKDDADATHWMAVTHFESSSCRRAVPCYDEPSAKATWDVKLIVKENLVALSNTHQIGEQKADGHPGFKEVTYATTPIMSSYLLAFAVGDFKYYELHTEASEHGPSIPVRTYTPPGREKEGQFAAEVAVKTLALYEKIFKIPYPLKKLDQIAVPDFDAGAMENWGLITYRNVYLLVNDSTSTDTKITITEVVCHELAHQWFGNLVTMEWWDQLWLNESFATWVAAHAVDTLHPEYKLWETYVSNDAQQGFGLDSLRSSHQIEVPCGDPADINQIFDAISYSKGGAVLRMLALHLGLDVFLNGVARYLAKHKWGNATTEDLWAAISEESGQDILGFMDNWIKKIGFPVLEVEEKANANGFELTVTQKRYLAAGDLKPEEDTTVWWTPLAIKEQQSGSAKASIRAGDDSILKEKKANFSVAQVYKLNADARGFYRVNYTPERLIQLGAAAKKQFEAGASGDDLFLNTSDRIGLIADAGALPISGTGKTSGFLGLAAGFNGETEVHVWTGILTALGKISSVWYTEPEAVQQGIQKYKQDVLDTIVKRVGFEYPKGETPSQVQLRTKIILAAAEASHPEVVAELRKRYDAYMGGDQAALHPELIGPALASVMQEGGSEADWKAIEKLYLNPKTPDETKLDCLRALNASRDPAIIDKTITWWDSGVVKDQDFIYLPLGLAGRNPPMRGRFWKYLTQNFDTIVAKYGDAMATVGMVVKIGVQGFVRPEDISTAEEFFKTKDTKTFQRGLEQGLETAHLNAKWLANDRKDVEEYLKKGGYLP